MCVGGLERGFRRSGSFEPRVSRWCASVTGSYVVRAGWRCPRPRPRSRTPAGRALYVAQAYEEKCKSLLRFGHLVESMHADPEAGLEELFRTVPRGQMLKNTLDQLAEILPSAADHAQVLQKAREARNYIAHEGVRFSVHDSRASDLLKCLSGLRAQVQLLASGDNLVSAWLFELEEPYEPSGEQWSVLCDDG
jgi:hypothetical protein